MAILFHLSMLFSRFIKDIVVCTNSHFLSWSNYIPCYYMNGLATHQMIHIWILSPFGHVNVIAANLYVYNVMCVFLLQIGCLSHCSICEEIPCPT